MVESPVGWSSVLLPLTLHREIHRRTHGRSVPLIVAHIQTLPNTMAERYNNNRRDCQLVLVGGGADSGSGSGADASAAAEDRDRHDPFAEELDEQVQTWL